MDKLTRVLIFVRFSKAAVSYPFRRLFGVPDNREMRNKHSRVYYAAPGEPRPW